LQSIAIFEKQWFGNARNVMMISCWKCAAIQRSLWSININRHWFGKLKYNDFVERKSLRSENGLIDYRNTKRSPTKSYHS